MILWSDRLEWPGYRFYDVDTIKLKEHIDINIMKIRDRTSRIESYDSWLIYDHRAKEIMDWCDANVSNQYSYASGHLYFTDESDATFFLLKWSNYE